MKRFAMAAAVALSLGATSASANLLTNGDFEANNLDVANGGFTTVVNGAGTIGGWTVGGISVDLVKGNYGFIDNVSVDLAGTPGAGTLSQSFAVVEGQSYLLEFDHFQNGAGTDMAVTFGSLPVINLAPPGAITSASYLWVSDFSGNATVTFASGLGFDGPTLDNVSVTVVPEPETYAMMIAGLGAMGFMARRRKNKA